jgi:hypothetical protein
MKDINNFNSKGERNGYQEWYAYNGKLYLRANYKNNNLCGYEEYHFSNHTTFYIR